MGLDAQPQIPQRSADGLSSLAIAALRVGILEQEHEIDVRVREKFLAAVPSESDEADFLQLIGLWFQKFAAEVEDDAVQ